MVFAREREDPGEEVMEEVLAGVTQNIVADWRRGR
jgi:hypothetical protein